MRLSLMTTAWETIVITDFRFASHWSRVLTTTITESKTKAKPKQTQVAFSNAQDCSVRISSYGCTREVWRAREKRKSCF